MMNEINQMQAVRLVYPTTDAPPAAQQTPPPAEQNEPVADAVEFSDTGVALADLEGEGGIRFERVARIRSEIQNGLYDVNGKLASVVDAILKDITG